MASASDRDGWVVMRPWGSVAPIDHIVPRWRRSASGQLPSLTSMRTRCETAITESAANNISRMVPS